MRLIAIKTSHGSTRLKYPPRELEVMNYDDMKRSAKEKLEK